MYHNFNLVFLLLPLSSASIVDFEQVNVSWADELVTKSPKDTKPITTTNPRQ